jgi:hypothetical protein
MFRVLARFTTLRFAAGGFRVCGSGDCWFPLPCRVKRFPKSRNYIQYNRLGRGSLLSTPNIRKQKPFTPSMNLST